MTVELPGALFREAAMELAVIGGPLLGLLLAVGLVVGVLQAVTQVNDPAVSAVPRFLTVILVCVVLGGWMSERLAGFFASAVIRMAGH